MEFNTGHALVIGVGTYTKAPQLDVPQTAEDARQVAKLLADPDFCGYPAGQVTLLTGATATRQNILAALESLSSTSDADTLTIFYSGHGHYGKDSYYLTTGDTEIVDRKVVAGTGVREAELLERLNNIPAGRALLIFNACHAGALAPTALGEEPGSAAIDSAALPAPLTTALLDTGKGRVVITACKEQQKSYFIPTDQTTLFAQYLIDGLQGRGVESRRGYISAFDLYEYIYYGINGEVKRRWKVEQDPVLTIHQGIGVMAVALYRGASAQGPLNSQDQPTALGGEVREVDPATSRAAKQQILNGELNLAAGRDISGNTVVHGNQQDASRDIDTIAGNQYKAENDINIGDKSDARASQGFLLRPTGPVSQTFGKQTTIDTSGGDYAEGDIEKQQGVFMSGGTVYGPVTGSNNGMISASYGTQQQSASGATSPLRNIRSHLRQVIDAAQARGDNNLAMDLDGVEQILGEAIRAERENDNTQRARKLRQAQADLDDLAVSQPALKDLVGMLQQVQ